MILWAKIHTASLLVFFVGMVALCIGDLWFQLWPSITIPMGLTLAFTGGAIGIVSGIALLLTPGYRV